MNLLRVNYRQGFDADDVYREQTACIFSKVSGGNGLYSENTVDSHEG